MRDVGSLNNELHEVEGGHAHSVWGGFVKKHLCQLEAYFESGAPVKLRAEVTSVGNFSVMRVFTHFGRMLIKGRAAEQNNDLSDRILIGVPIRGRMDVAQFGREGVSRAGAMHAVMLTEDMAVTKHNDVDVINLLIPRDYSELHKLDPRKTCGRLLPVDGGVAKLAADTIKSLWNSSHKMSEYQFSVAVKSASDLVLLALTQCGDTRSSIDSVRQANLVKAREFIKSHAEEPDLNPRFIAAACGVSLRYLHSLFQDSGESVSKYVRRCRLEMASRLLMHPKNTKINVTDVCFACGFSNASHFTMLFRQQYGRTPREVLIASQG